MSAPVCLTACLEPPAAAVNARNSATNLAAPKPGSLQVALPGGAKAAKILFKAGSRGSFDPPSPNGTPATPGSGLRAQRLFKADTTDLATAGTSAWPAWLSSVEIGVSGPANAAATNPDCARFAGANEGSVMCDYNANGVADVKCGADADYYRVSEYDCVRNGAPKQGDGSGSDGIYIRATFSRDTAKLGANENLMAVLEFAASSINAGATNPVACFANAQFRPDAEGCADMMWNTYLKAGSGLPVSPFLMLVPPTFGSVNMAANTGGSGLATRQFYIPLASDPTLDQLQISRIRGPNPNATYGNGGPSIATLCNGSQTPANSPLCVGMILYSLTFFRI